MPKYLVLDTNILLLDANNLVSIANEHPNTIIVLPETVLDEVDAKKSGHSELAYQARSVGRLLNSAAFIETVTKDQLTVNRLRLNNIEIHIVSTTYPAMETTAPNIVNDRKILHVAKAYHNLYKNVCFMSNDVMCRIRAQSLGLATTDYKVVSDIELEFVKELTVDSKLFSNLHTLDITTVDPNYRPEHYNYIFIDAFTEQRKLATITNGVVQVIGKATEKEIRAQDFPPINSGQLFLSKAILDPQIDIVVCDSKAGTGKTLTTLSNAIKLVRDTKTPYESIVYIRSSVDDLEKAETIGYLSGNSEKVEVYIRPLEDALEAIVRNRLKSSKRKGVDLETAVADGIQKLKTQCSIQGIITLGLRGRTLRNSVIIVDEVANLSKASLQKVLTRVGEHCKVILVGSNKQIDNLYLTKYTNGLSVILDACRQSHPNVRLHAVTLPKVVRGNIAEFAEDLFTQS
jgi:PhoH-like ATPase